MNKSASCLVSPAACIAAASAGSPDFTPVQPKLFSAPYARSSAFADIDGDGDGDPDLDAGVSGDEGVPARNLLFRNDGGSVLVEVAKGLELKVLDADSRQVNWIDYDNDGGALVDIAPQLRMHQPERTLAEVTVKVTFLAREGRKRNALRESIRANGLARHSS